VQEALRNSNEKLPEAERLYLRIGVHQGEVVAEDGDLLGDGVIVAARLEPLAEPGGICISGRVREDAAGKLPLDVEDLGEPALKHIAQKVRVFRVRLGPAAQPALALPDKPSLAVLPFTNMSGDAEQEYFADGVVEDIITALSRVGWLFVIARNSSFTYKGRAVDIKQVGRELGVRYVLEGSVRRAGGRVRITCQLIEAANGGHVWADRFDGELTDIFDLQDRIAESVVGAIEPSLQRAEISRAKAKPTESLDAYDLYLRALEQFYTTTRPGSDAAVALLQRAMRIDPGYSLARAFLAYVHFLRNANGWGAPADAATAVALAREALATSRDDPLALRYAGLVLCHFARDYEPALAALGRAVRLSPNSGQVLWTAALVQCYVGEPEPAIALFQRAIRLSPLDPEIGFMLVGLGLAHVIAGRDMEAVPLLQQAIREMPSLASTYRHLVIALTRLGRIDEARAAASRVLEIDPGFRISTHIRPYRGEEFSDAYVKALRLVGLPE
jgi:adenylate cyclase